MKTWPLRWRIAVLSALASALALLTFTTIVAINLYSEQVEAIDTRLAAIARLVRIDPTATNGFNRDAFSALAADPQSRGDAPLFGFALLRTGDGRVIQSEPSALGTGGTFRLDGAKPFSREIDGTKLRFASFTWGEQTLLLAASLEPADESVQDLLGSAALALPIVLLVVMGGSWWIARHALSPIAAITRAAASITADQLGRRLPPPGTTDEIGRHVEVLNGMFDRLQRSFELATRFTADAAHELRTPLTIMRCQVEDALRSATPESEPLLICLLDEITGLQKISETLLLLARFDSGSEPLQLAPLNLSVLLREVAEDAELLAVPKALSVTAEIEPDVRVSGDEVMLRRVALNLLDNAVKFNRESGEVRLALRTHGAAAVFSVGNTGTGISPEQRSALFKRFHRPDADRNRAAGGSGLGLSLCREIVTAHNGTIELRHANADWTEFSFTLPRLA